MQIDRLTLIVNLIPFIKIFFLFIESHIDFIDKHSANNNNPIVNQSMCTHVISSMKSVDFIVFSHL